MTRTNWIILGLVYILGLWFANVISDTIVALSKLQLSILLTVSIALIVLSVNAIEDKLGKWIVAILVLLCAVSYFQLRVPQPQFDDISYQIAQDERTLVEIRGKVLTEPRLTNSQRLKFWLAVREINNGETVSGKVYATIPLLQGTGILSGQQLKLTGYLYLPQENKSDGFDFKHYLARQGIFAGIQGIEAEFDYQPPRGLAWLRQRIVRSHLKGLGSPVGQLVSSMVLGRKAVDLPNDIRDRFITAGLAHVLAASGFHVSLLLGIVLKLTERIAAKPRLIVGIGTLIVYLGLTGVQASVLRACLMGSAMLLALAMETKVKPLGSLLLVATAILLYNPLLIGDLGFKLSFLATFGLIVTLPKLQSKLDWLPVAIATLISVPVAASIWVLPLLCYEFHTLATYSLVVNAFCTPLISLISLGGMISAIIAIILPAVGSAIASWLYYPTTLLITITEFVTSLPGSTWAVGQIPVIGLVGIYGIFILIWLNKWWQKRWWLGLLLPIVLTITTVVYNSTQVQITVLPTGKSLAIVIQDRDRVILINSGRENSAKYNLLPFLARQGINYIDYGLAYGRNSNSKAEWSVIARQVGVGKIYGSETAILPDIRAAVTGIFPEIVTKSVRLTRNKELNAINIEILGSNWLIIGKFKDIESNRLASEIKKYLQNSLVDSQPIVVWSGKITPAWLELLHPEMAIANNNSLHEMKWLQKQEIEFYNLLTEGIISWSPDRGFDRQQEILN